MKKLLTIFTVLFAFGFEANAQLYRLVLNSTDFYNVQSGTQTNAYMATNLISSTRFLTIGTGKLAGRTTAGTGGIEQISVGTGLTLAGGTLSSSASGGTNYVFNANQFAINAATNVSIKTGNLQTNSQFYSSGTGGVLGYVYDAKPQFLFGYPTGNPDYTYPVISFQLNNTYGFDLQTGGYLSAIISGTERVRFDSAGLKVGAGSAGGPSIASISSTASGMSWPNASSVSLSGGGVRNLIVTNNYIIITNFAVNEVYYSMPTSSETGFWKANGASPNVVSMGAVDLSSSDVTGDLGISHFNGGSGASATTYWRGDGTWVTPAGSGTVTSVGLSAPTQFSVSGTPVTTSGTLALSWANVSSNKFLAGPINNGAAAAPTFRVLDVSDFNSGTSASSSTFWRGDATWATPPMASPFFTLTSSSNVIGGIAGPYGQSFPVFQAGGYNTGPESGLTNNGAGITYLRRHISWTNGLALMEDFGAINNTIQLSGTVFDNKLATDTTIIQLPQSSIPGTEYIFNCATNPSGKNFTISLPAANYSISVGDFKFDTALVSVGRGSVTLSYRLGDVDNTGIWQVTSMTGLWTAKDSGLFLGDILFESGRVVTNYSVYASGTAYSVTTSSAALDFGTTDPVITITIPGTYLIQARVNYENNGSTFAADRLVTTKLRRTNNTAADLSNSSTVYHTGTITTVTSTASVMNLPSVIYTTANSNDSITIYAGIDAGPTAGSFDAIEANIVATRLY